MYNISHSFSHYNHWPRFSCQISHMYIGLCSFCVCVTLIELNTKKLLALLLSALCKLSADLWLISFTFTDRHTRTHARTHAHTHTHTDTDRHARTHAHTHRHRRTHARTHKHRQTQTDTHARTHTRTHRHRQTHTRTHAHTNTDTDRHTHTHTHTCTHTHTHTPLNTLLLVFKWNGLSVNLSERVCMHHV